MYCEFASILLIIRVRPSGSFSIGTKVSDATPKIDEQPLFVHVVFYTSPGIHIFRAPLLALINPFKIARPRQSPPMRLAFSSVLN